MGSPGSVRRTKPVLTISVVAVLALLAGAASEIGRRILKGEAYAYSGFSDGQYYKAMATRLWQTPLDIQTEIAKLGFLITSGDISDK